MKPRIKDCFLYIKEYGIKCFVAVCLSKVFSYTDNGPQWKWNILQYKHKAIMQYLYKYSYIQEEDHSLENKSNNTEYKNCIWTTWLQGEENAPEIIQLNLASIRKNSSGHSVIVITNENVNCFINIPESIMQKHLSGIIGHAHYSDIIRMMILAQYGGIWLVLLFFYIRRLMK